MVKSIISSPLTRKVATMAMLTTSVTLASANNLNTNNVNNETNQTELMSYEAATSLRAKTVDIIDCHEHNKKIDKLLLNKLDKAKDTKEIKAYIDDTYKKLGTFGATIELQRLLDDISIENTIDQYLSNFTFLDKNRDIAKQLISQFYGWKDNVFYTDLKNEEITLHLSQKSLSADDYINKIDEHINNDSFFNEEEIDIYKNYSKDFVSKQKNKNSLQAKSDLLAYKVHLLNSLAFNKFFLQDNRLPNERTFFSLFNYNFIFGEDTIKP